MVKVVIGVPTATLSSDNITISSMELSWAKIAIGVPTELETVQ